MATGKKDVAHGDITIGRAANHYAAIELAAGYLLAVGFDYDVGHSDIIEPSGLFWSIFPSGNSAGQLPKNTVIIPSPTMQNQALAIAVQHHQAGRLAEAETIYRQVLVAEPNNAAALELLGTLLGQRGDMRGGEELLRRALSIWPESFSAYINLGEFCRRQGRPGEALAATMESIRYRPTAAGYENMAAALRDLHCDAAAADAQKVAVKFDPNHRPAAVSPGGRPPLRMAEVMHPREAVALSAAFTHLHRYEDAIAAAERATELAPAMADAYVNLGWLYSLVGRLNDAEAACEKAIALQPGDPAASLNLGVLRLLRGDFDSGWQLYEFRKQCPGFSFARHRQPMWDGKPLGGRRILLWFEQGLGDTLQFLRFVPQVIDRGGEVLLAVQPELGRLVAASMPAQPLVDPAQPMPAFDVQCSLLSLPMMLGTRLETIPQNVPYVHAPTDLVSRWKARVETVGGRFRVGLSWAGRPGHINDANRSMQLEALAPLAGTGATFFSLQKWNTGFSISRAAGGVQLIDWTADLADMADTAALIANLDLVISIDSAMAHLAGAMGRPTWLLLPAAPDWRWLLGRVDSPWYPTMRIFRQPRLGDWTIAVSRMADELGTLVENRG